VSELALARGGSRLRRAAQAAGLALLLAAGAWLGGFGWFVREAMQPSVAPPHADGIVCLTGGADRVETALRLLEAGYAPKLLISGVGASAELEEFTRRIGVAAGPIAGRVTLGRAATSTFGNATETAAWVHANGIRTLIVVTSGYHMARALIEIGRALPDVTLHPRPVLAPSRQGGYDPAMLRLFADEYTKWLASLVGLNHLPQVNLPAAFAHPVAARPALRGAG
jgi:uncharacterized SAM-binding protein YcdF (DUF218 family)